MFKQWHEPIESGAEENNIDISINIIECTIICFGFTLLWTNQVFSNTKELPIAAPASSTMT